MPNSAGVEVARISVKVSPDTSEFYNELKRKLKAVEKALGKEEFEVVDLDVDADTGKAETKVAKATKRMSKNKVKVSAEVDKIDTSAIARSIGDSIGALDKYAGKFDVKNGLFWNPKEGQEATQVAIDNFNILKKQSEELAASEARRAAAEAKSLQDATDKTNKLAAARKKADDDAVFKMSMRKEFVEGRSENNRVGQEFDIAWDKARASVHNIDVVLRPTLSKWDPRAIRAMLGFKTGIDIPVNFTEGKGGKGGKGGGVGGAVTGAAATAGGAVGAGVAGKFPKALIPSFGSGVNPAGMAAIIAAGLIALAPVVGLITTALLALPGIIGMMLAPIGAVALALDGIKEAAKVLEEPFNKLRETLSNIAKEQFGPMFESVGRIFPTLERAIPFVTQGLADMGKAVADFFAQGEGQVMLENTISGIGKAFTQMSPGVRDLVAALTGLADEFVNGGALEGVGNWFNDTMADFRAWVKEVSDNGQLTTAFDNLGKTIKTVIDWLGDLMGTGFNFMAQEGAIDGFNATLKKIGDTIVAVTEFSAKLNEQWQSMVQIGRGLGIFTDLLSGDLGGAWSNAKDLFANKPWQDQGGSPIPAAANVDNSIGGVESLNKALENTQFKSQQAQESLSQLMGTAAPAKIQGPGFNGDYPVNGSLPGKPAEGEKPKVQAPDTTEAMAALQKYKSEAETTMAAAKTAVESATTATVKPPDLGPFTSAFDELPGKVAQAMDAVTQSVTTGGANAANAALLVSVNIYNALVANVALFQTVGLQMMAGLAAGIDAGSSMAIQAAINAATNALAAAKAALDINSPSKKFITIGESTMEGMAVGMENGFQPVMDQAKEMADKVAQAFSDGSDPTIALKGFDKKEINRMEKVLGQQSKDLGRQAKALDYRGLKDDAARVRELQNEVNSRKELLDLANDYNEESGSGGGEDPFVKGASQLMNSPVDFLKATGSQFMSDLGIGGDGLIGKAITEGISYVFNIGSVDEALSIKDREDTKAALPMVGR